MNIIKRSEKKNENELAAKEAEWGSVLSREWNRSVNRMRRFFDEPWSLATDLFPWPAMDLSETEQSVTWRLDVPGITPDKINVELSGNVLTVSGSREEESKGGNGGAWHHERHEGSFVRSIELPSYVDLGKIDSNYDKGVLTVTAAKIPGAGPKRIPVKTS